MNSFKSYYLKKSWVKICNLLGIISGFCKIKCYECLILKLIKNVYDWWLVF